jgi:signal transduction histidine kinase
MSNSTSARGRTAATVDLHRLLAYIADLELEVDRLRKQGGFIRQEVGDGLNRIERLCDDPAAIRQVTAAVRDLVALLKDLQDPPGYHPAHDQVVAIAVRPLVEQVFQWQRRLTGNRDVTLRLELEVDHVEWFPARLRHILDNLLSNALKYRDPAKAEAWVFLGLRASDRAYEFRVSDNGTGLPEGEGQRAFELLSRAAPVREAGLSVGLPVVRLLVEQSGGSLTVQSEPGRGTDFVLVLPRYDIADYLT